jgi:phosphoglycerate dehydrogenase-like enzyme
VQKGFRFAENARGGHMMRCVILDDYQNVALAMADWSALSGEVDVEVLTSHITDREALVARLDGAQIVVAMRERTPFDAALFARLPALRLLVTTGTRNAAIDMAAAAAHGVVVCGTEGGSRGTAELAWALILALMRQLPREAEGLRRGGGPWQRTVGHEVAGKTLGIIGFGRLGSAMARVGLAFGMEVTALSRSLTPARAGELGVVLAGSLDELLASADIVTIHLVLSDTSRGLIGARELALMKPSAYLINTARGPIVDEAALAAALRERRIAGAGIDVFDVEPLHADHPFRTLDNVIATPHLGYVTAEAYGSWFPQIVDNIAAWRAGSPKRVIAG